jgi:hypothetical protein
LASGVVVLKKLAAEKMSQKVGAGNGFVNSGLVENLTVRAF